MRERLQSARIARIRSTKMILLASLVVGCTSFESYPAGRLGPDLPITVGDEVRVYPGGAGAESKTLTVTSIDDHSISGESSADGGAVLTYRWDSLGSIAHRQFDAGKSLGLAIIVIWLLHETRDFAESFGDSFDRSD